MLGSSTCWVSLTFSVVQSNTVPTSSSQSKYTLCVSELSSACSVVVAVVAVVVVSTVLVVGADCVELLGNVARVGFDAVFLTLGCSGVAVYRGAGIKLCRHCSSNSNTFWSFWAAASVLLLLFSLLRFIGVVLFRVDVGWCCRCRDCCINALRASVIRLVFPYPPYLQAMYNVGEVPTNQHYGSPYL